MTNNRNQKIDSDKMKDIKLLFEANVPQKTIAETFKIHPATVARILKGNPKAEIKQNLIKNDIDYTGQFTVLRSELKEIHEEIGDLDVTLSKLNRIVNTLAEKFLRNF